MPNSSDRHTVNRRRFFGAGAGAAAALGSGSAVAAAGGFGPAPDSDAPGHPMALPVKLPGTTLGIRSKFDFVAVDTAGGSWLNEEETSRGTYNGGGGGYLVTTLDIPALARVRKIDAYGFRVTNGVQNWHVKKTDLSGAVTTIASQAVTASGPVQATFEALDIVLEPGERMFVEISPSSAVSTALGVAYQYTDATAGLVLFGDPASAGDAGNTTPRSPVRVYDSRRDDAGKLGRGQERRISVANEIIGAGPGRPNVVPVGARAIAYNLTITDTETNYGYLTVIPAGESNFDNSAINWDKPGTTIANGLIVGINANREIVVRCDGFPATPVRTHFVIDVTGYFV